MNSSLAPIALFTYNRLDHTQKTVEALRANELASDSELFIFSDGARKTTDEAAVNEVRSFLKTVTGFKKIHLIESPNNKGLADSIITGVTQLTDEFGKVIVLEDDIVTSPLFLKFMNDALNFYENQPKVMHISGYVFPVSVEDHSPETFFIAPTTCWGWATWKRSWVHFNRSASDLVSKFSPSLIREFNLNGGTDYFSQLMKNKTGELKTWAVLWSASVFLSKGLSLHPSRSYCLNIGHDGTGEHCSTTDQYNVILNQKSVIDFENTIQESSDFRKKVERFLKGLRPSLWTRILNKLKTFV